MKNLLRLLLAGLLAAGPSRQTKVKRNADGSVNLESEMPPDAKHLALGDAAPDFKLLGIDGKTYSLADFPASQAPVLMVVFLSNHCPYSHAAETRLLPLAREFAGKGSPSSRSIPTAPRASTSPSSATANTTTVTRR